MDTNLTLCPVISTEQSQRAIRYGMAAFALFALIGAAEAQTALVSPVVASTCPPGEFFNSLSTAGTFGCGTVAGAATSAGVSAIGNTTGLTSSQTQALTSGAVSGAGNVSVGYSSNSLIIFGSAPAASATSGGQSAIGNTAGLTSSQTAPLTASAFSGAGGVSLGFSNGTAVFSGATTAASGTANSAAALGNTTGATSSSVLTLNQLSVSGAGGVSAGFSTTGAGAGVLVLSGATTAASQGTLTVDAAGNTTGLTSSSSTTLPAAIHLSGAGGVSVGLSSSTIVISGATTAASATSGNLFAIGNTTGATSSTTTALTNLSLSGAGGASVGFSTTAAGAGVAIISGATGGGASATSAGQTALGNTAGLTSSQSAPLTASAFSGAGGVSVGFSNGTAIFSGATGGGAGASTMSIMTIGGEGSFSLNVGNPIQIRDFYIPQPIVMNEMWVIGSAPPITYGSSTRTGTASYTSTSDYNLEFIMYSQAGGTSSGQFVSFTSSAADISFSISLSHESSSFSISETYTFPNGSTTASTSSSTATSWSTTGAVAWNDFFSSLYAGIRLYEIPFAASLSPGNYMIGALNSNNLVSFGGNLTHSVVSVMNATGGGVQATMIPGVISTSLSAGFNITDFKSQNQPGGIRFTLGNFTS